MAGFLRDDLEHSLDISSAIAFVAIAFVAITFVAIIFGAIALGAIFQIVVSREYTPVL